MYAEGYPGSGKDKFRALSNKGQCLFKLNKYEEADFACK